MAESLTYRMLRSNLRDFVIKQVKAPLETAIIMAASLLPDPTKENTYHPNTHRLIELEELFFSYDTNPSKRRLLKAVWKLLIIENEHDPYYRDRFNWGVEKIVNGEWKPRSIGHPNKFWNEPEPYGGYPLIKK